MKITVEEACNQSSRFYDALNGQERIIYMTGAKFGANWQSQKERELREALSELVDLMQGVIDGDYKPDSFTLQVAKEALKTKPL